MFWVWLCNSSGRCLYPIFEFGFFILYYVIFNEYLKNTLFVSVLSKINVIVKHEVDVL